MKEETGGREAILLVLDLSSLASVRKAAEEFLNKEHTLNVLFNNAGVMASPIDMVTVDGYDAQFGTNVIGHWLFTELLTPALLAGTETSPDHHSRVVTTSSAAAMLDTIYFDALKDGPARRKRGHQLYAQSKFGNVVVARQVPKRHGDKGIISLSVDPGAIQSDLNRHILEESRGIKGVLVRAWFKAVLRPPSFGALTQLWAGTMPEALNHNGEYLVPTAQIAPCRREAYDDELGENLWSWLEEEVKDKPRQ